MFKTTQAQSKCSIELQPIQLIDIATLLLAHWLDSPNKNWKWFINHQLRRCEWKHCDGDVSSPGAMKPLDAHIFLIFTHFGVLGECNKNMFDIVRQVLFEFHSANMTSQSKNVYYKTFRSGDHTDDTLQVYDNTVINWPNSSSWTVPSWATSNGKIWNAWLCLFSPAHQRWWPTAQ